MTAARQRVRRMLAKRPRPIAVEIAHAPATPPATRAALVDLLVEMLDYRRNSGRG